MSWGTSFEMYLLGKKSEQSTDGKTIAFTFIKGELWNDEEILAQIDELQKFCKKAKRLVKANPNKNCIRTNE